MSGVVVISVADWRSALASQAATARFIEAIIEKLDVAAETQGYCGPQMPWHEWLEDLA